METCIPLMVSRRRLPPVEQIEAFLHAARAPNFRTAAEQLALSPAALTRRIRAFTDYVGEELFERAAGGMRLTDAGQRCVERLAPTFFSLRDAAADVGQHDSDNRQVKVSISHSLAVSWLIPKLPEFREAYPAIEILPKIERTSARVRSGEVDIGICHVGIDCSRLRMETLFGVNVTPVAAPSILAKAGSIRLQDQYLLVSAQSENLWEWWALETGYSGELVAHTEYDILQGMYEAAACGLGVALGASPTVWPHIQSGRLVPLGLDSAYLPEAYRLISTDARLELPHVAAVWDWLLREGEVVRELGTAAMRPPVPAVAPANGRSYTPAHA